MDLSLKQELKQKQILSQQLHQSLQILQLGALELESKIVEVLESNPLLERESEPVVASRFSGSANFIRDYQPSMEDQLRRQLYHHEMDEKIRTIADYLINYLDDNGLLQLDREDPRLTHLSESSLQAAIECLQALEPCGIAARSIGECLYLQLRQLREVPPVIEQLLKQDLEALAMGKLHMLSNKYGLERSEISDLLEEIQTLDPRPGQQIAPADPEYIIADVVIHRVNPLEIELSPFSFPNLRYNSSYDHYMQGDSREYLKQKQSQAKLIIYALEQRAETMKRILTVLVEMQADFFTPEQRLQPLTRQVVADRLELHNSTVSRAVQDKFFLWQNRIFPMSIFFPKGVERLDGSKISSQMIKRYILEIIAEEAADAPLSDQAINEVLKAKGLAIARRTVTKYRQELGIARSNMRQRLEP